MLEPRTGTSNTIPKFGNNFQLEISTYKYHYHLVISVSEILFAYHVAIPGDLENRNINRRLEAATKSTSPKGT